MAEKREKSLDWDWRSPHQPSKHVWDQLRYWNLCGVVYPSCSCHRVISIKNLRRFQDRSAMSNGLTRVWHLSPEEYDNYNPIRSRVENFETRLARKVGLILRSMTYHAESIPAQVQVCNATSGWMMCQVRSNYQSSMSRKRNFVTRPWKLTILASAQQWSEPSMTKNVAPYIMAVWSEDEILQLANVHSHSSHPMVYNLDNQVSTLCHST